MKFPALLDRAPSIAAAQTAATVATTAMAASTTPADRAPDRHPLIVTSASGRPHRPFGVNMYIAEDDRRSIYGTEVWA